VVFETGVCLTRSRLTLHDALEVLGPEWSLVLKATSHLSMHLKAKAVVDCQSDRAA
jgi:hypothetical protein